MLSRSVRSSLCLSCRNDLLAIFENGLATPVPARSLRRQLLLSTPRPPHLRIGTTRTFSSRPGLRASSSDTNSTTNRTQSDGEAIEELYSQLDAIKQDPRIPKIGDLDESGLEFTEERVEQIAQDVWLMKYGQSSTSETDAQYAVEGEDHVRASEDAPRHIEDQNRHTGQQLDGFNGPDEPFSPDERPLGDTADSETPLLGSVEAVREAEGSLEDVAREARQLHGEHLPDGVLNEDESRTYRRLYGDPAEKVEMEENRGEIEEQGDAHELLDADGQPVVYERRNALLEVERPPQSGGIQFSAEKSLEEQAMEIAEQIGGEVRPCEESEYVEEEAVEKGHPLTMKGKFSTLPRTVFLPQGTFVQPVQKILSEYSNKHIKEMCEKQFGGLGLPDSPLTPRSGRVLPQKPIPLDASQHGMGTMEANAYVSAVWPGTYATVISVLTETRKRLGSRWLRDLMTKDGGPSVLDAGAGGVGILAWRDIMKAEWESLHSSDASPPPAPQGRSTVLTGADNLRYRASTLLENTTFLPRLPDYVHVRDTATLSDDRPASQRKQYDVVVAPHTLWQLDEEWQRKQQVQNLWSLLNPDGGVLVLIEKGIPRGFEVIAGARELLLSRYIATAHSAAYISRLEAENEEGMVHKGKGMIIAPCTNHAPCPMYPVLGVSRGRKDYCSFSQRYIRPPFLQRILGAKDRNHDDVDFSYIAVQKGRDLQDTSLTGQPIAQGKDATNSAFDGYEEFSESEEVDRFNALTLPRIVFHPLKRPGHVTMDLCTPAGKIERWTVSKSFSKTAYRDARKAAWGDLWALGAKTRVPRNLRLGGEKSKKGKNPSEKMRTKAQGIVERMKEEKLADREMEAEMKMAAQEDVEDMLNDEDIDRDAEDVLKQIEMEKRQKKAEAAQYRQKMKEKRAPIVEEQFSPGEATPVRYKNGPKAAFSRRNPSTTKPIQVSNSIPPSAPHSPTTDPDPSTSRPEPEPDLDPELLTPQERAALRDFAAESHQDRLHALANERLRGNSARAKQRMRAGENKFADPRKERWREGVEKKKSKRKTEEKQARARE
jgi:ribosomal protein RSM22 (predicted rRNA methylase)